MSTLHEVPLTSQSIDRLEAIAGAEAIEGLRRTAEPVLTGLKGRVVWNVNSTARGGGVAEMLADLLPYVRGFDINTRWLVIGGNPEFFQITKRIHHALHGSAGDGSQLADAQRVTYEDVLRENASHLTALVAAGDIVLLHDPQTAGLASHLQALGATVIWRCHIGTDESNSEVEYGWRFLEPYLQDVSATVFTRRQYVPACCDSGRAVIIPPSIEPFSAKNQEMDADTVRSILALTGLLELPGTLRPVFSRKDGSPGGVDRRADIVRVGSAPTWDTPLIAQISRWDPLKDHLGVMEGFVRLLERPGSSRAHLVLAGPTVSGVADDPEVGATLDEIIKRWHGLPHGYRRKVHVACLPMDDSDENAAIVNALQRHATIVVQKSLKEGFGLTVTEAMWKARPLVASAVGGIKDQIVSGVHGRLISDPRNLDEFADALELLLAKEDYAKAMGKNAQARVREEYLTTRHLMQYAELLQRIGI